MIVTWAEVSHATQKSMETVCSDVHFKIFFFLMEKNLPQLPQMHGLLNHLPLKHTIILYLLLVCVLIQWWAVSCCKFDVVILIILSFSTHRKPAFKAEKSPLKLEKENVLSSANGLIILQVILQFLEQLTSPSSVLRRIWRPLLARFKAVTGATLQIECLNEKLE